MDARYVQRGDAIDYTPMADVAAGDVVVLANKLVGVAKLDIKVAELGALALTGVYEVAKASGAAFAVGMEVAWDATNRKAVAAGASGNGVFTAAKENPGVFVIGCDVDQYNENCTTSLIRVVAA